MATFFLVFCRGKGVVIVFTYSCILMINIEYACSYMLMNVKIFLDKNWHLVYNAKYGNQQFNDH